VKETLERFWDKEGAVWVFQPPDHAVVTGAAIYSYLRRRYPGYILSEPAADAYYVRLKDRFDLILPARQKEGDQKRYELVNDADFLRLEIFAGEEPQPGETQEDIWPTLIHQGGAKITFDRTYQKGTPVWVQMSYAGESGEQERLKVPWVSVWIVDNGGDPLFRKRYSELVKGESNG
jgi:hypothetical protein